MSCLPLALRVLPFKELQYDYNDRLIVRRFIIVNEPKHYTFLEVAGTVVNAPLEDAAKPLGTWLE